MKISRIIIQGFQQFQNVDIDLTYPSDHPKAGKALDKICFIGRNGTGKSTLLRIIRNALQSVHFEVSSGEIFIKLQLEEESIYIRSRANLKHDWTQEQIKKVRNPDQWIEERAQRIKTSSRFIVLEKIEELPEFTSYLSKNQNKPFPLPSSRYLGGRKNMLRKVGLENNANDCLIYSPSESHENQYLNLDDLPNTNLSNALSLFKEMPFYHLISEQTSASFWNLLIYQIKKRESDFQEYLKQAENRKKTVEEVENTFDEEHPQILKKLAQVWNRILEKAKLEFDIENASIPVQLTDNLEAYIQLSHSKQKVRYNQLSTGIRNFIFRLGHIYLLHFNRTIEKSFLLIDEPENSLYPDFLYDLIDEYTQITPNTQAFFATHNPIIAAQFEPSERVILEFNDDGSVYTRRGSSPIGDDPNDLLTQDFVVSSLYGKQGQESWNRVLELQDLIDKEENFEKKKSFVEEYLRLTSEYNFSAKSKEL